MMLTRHQMLESGMRIEAVDKITASPWAGPSSAASERGAIGGQSNTWARRPKIAWIAAPDEGAEPRGAGVRARGRFFWVLVFGGPKGDSDAGPPDSTKKDAQRIPGYDVEDPCAYRSPKKVRSMPWCDQERGGSQEEDVLKRWSSQKTSRAIAWQLWQDAGFYSDGGSVNCGRHRQTSISHALGLQLLLGLRSWDAIGVRSPYNRMQQEGLAVRSGSEQLALDAQLLCGRPGGAQLLRRRGRARQSRLRRSQAIGIDRLKSDSYTALVKKNPRRRIRCGR